VVTAPRFGLAPVNWNNDDVPEWGARRGYAELVALSARLGYDGIEAGTGAPAAADGLRSLLLAHGQALPGAYEWARLSDPAVAAAEVERLGAKAAWLRAAGAEVLLVAEQWTEARRRVAGRAGDHPELSLPPERLACLCRSLEAAARRCRGSGLTLALHPHAGTPVETPAEVAAVMAGTDPDLVRLCLDTGHTACGGGEPLEAARRYAPRVAYVHAKDVDAAALAAARSGGLGLLDALRRGIFAPVYGAEAPVVDMDAVAAVLRAAGFAGWVIMECDRNPGAGDPDAEAAAALPRLRRAFGAPGRP
jgi:inosose dehydratase